MSTVVCTSKKPRKIAEWFSLEFFSDEEEEMEEYKQIMNSILTGEPDIGLISTWLHERRDMLIERWD